MKARAQQSAANDSAAADEAADAFRLEDFLPYRLAVASSQVSRLFTRKYAERFGLTIPEWRVLAVVGRFQTLSPSAVGQHAAMDKVKVSRAAASLAARGLVRQTQDPSDGRGRLLRLTRKGTTLHGQVIPEALALEAQVAAGLTRAEWTVLNKALAKLSAHCEVLGAAEEEDA
jgi:DNA-binding MarR family transcriptional regulator